MIITCPNCKTSYQVAKQAIGDQGRKVVCANCHQSWFAALEKNQQNKKGDEIFSPEDEKALDDEFEKLEKQQFVEKQINAKADTKKNINEIDSEEKNAPPENKLDNSIKRSKKKFLRKQRKRKYDKRPLKRLKIILRLILVTFLTATILLGYFWRNNIVDIFPQFAKIYETIGIKINIVGLEFLDVKTINYIDDGSDKISIKAKIHNITNRTVKVPSIVVNVLDKDENSLLQWSVEPMVKMLNPREILDFSTHIKEAPIGATQIKLSFAIESE